MTQIEVNIPHKHHNAVIGAKGRLIRSIMDECGGVSIKFPPEGSNSDKVLIRGPKDDVDKAKKQLLDLLNEKVWIRIVNNILVVKCCKCSNYSHCQTTFVNEKGNRY